MKQLYYTMLFIAFNYHATIFSSQFEQSAQDGNSNTENFKKIFQDLKKEKRKLNRQLAKLEAEVAAFKIAFADRGITLQDEDNLNNNQNGSNP